MPRETNHHAPRLLTLACAACWCFSASAVPAQELTRLPPTDPAITYQRGELGGRQVQPFDLATGAAGKTPAQFVAEREEQVQPIYLDEEAPLAPSVKKQSEGKDGFLQEVALVGTWLPQLEGDSMGFTETSISMTGGVPFPTRNLPLLITPFFQTMFIDGPLSPDLPPRVYSTYLQFRWLPKIGEKWRLDIGVAPGMYSDFQVDNEDAFRLTGRGIGIYTWSDQLTIAAGVLYLDRPDINILPVGGLIWTPNDDWKLELIFPKPKIAKRFYHFESTFAEEHWGYFTAEFGGDTWAIERADLTTDQFVYRDYRAMLGVQRKVIGGISTHVEIGYVFNRRIEYTSNTPDFEPNDTILLRMGAVY